jgi:hypothetical protein
MARGAPFASQHAGRDGQKKPGRTFLDSLEPALEKVIPH